VERLFPNQIEKQKASLADFDKIPTTTSITPPLQLSMAFLRDFMISPKMTSTYARLNDAAPKL
jgi:hypothetical protein